MEITRGVIPKAQKVVLYGPEGIGKSTFAAGFPGVVFIDTEGSTAGMDVARLPQPQSWAQLLNEVTYIRDHPKEAGTLALDTADWAEKLAVRYLCDKSHKQGIEDWGYGKGYTYLAEIFEELLHLLQDVVDRGVHVIVTAHAKITKFEQPDEMGAYDRWELKLTKQVAPLLKEWADMVLFANYKTLSVAVDDKGKKRKAQGGQRVLYTTHHPCWDGKNRHNLPDELPFAFSSIEEAIQGRLAAGKTAAAAPKETPAGTAPSPKATKAEELSGIVDEPAEPAVPPEPGKVPREEPDMSGLPKALLQLMKENEVSLWEIQQAVSQKGYYPVDTPVQHYDPAFIDGVLVAAWPQVFALIQGNRDLPFD